MNKHISFRDLIDLEPKPKKVMYCRDIYTLKENEVYYRENQISYLEQHMNFKKMKEPNIEIIEEDKPRIEKIPMDYEGRDKKFVLRDSFYQKVSDEDYAEYFAIKINELCDIINDMEKER